MTLARRVGLYSEEKLMSVVPLVKSWAAEGKTIGEIKSSARLIEADVNLIEAAISLMLDLDRKSSEEVTVVEDTEANRLPWYQGAQSSDQHWPALKSRLLKQLGNDAVGTIDNTTDSILRRMSSPNSAHFDTKGLVLGYVQSGKTTNFMSLAAKAVDRGYKLIVILSGMTEILRSQTQARIDDMLVADDLKWHQLTNIDSDFAETSAAGSLFKNFATSPGGAMIAVIKKNPARLRRLRDWLLGAGTHAMKHAPMIVIDDEADQASIDVGKDAVSTINSLLKSILGHPKSAYVAYSATPFANMLIDPNDEENLYPRDFIVPMPKPAGYFGAEDLFGDASDPDSTGLDVVRRVPPEDISSVRPENRAALKKGWTAVVSPSLRDAVRWFLLSTSARRMRNGRAQHSSMLVHTSMLSDVHFELKAALEAEIAKLRKQLASDSFVGSKLDTEFRQMWQKECNRALPEGNGYAPMSWETVRTAIFGVVEDIRLVVDNYKSTDRLTYASGDPATVIVLGGNTLSRGLTLEGLISSYFVRSASAYDTLLQMGRWFGYRQGYEDLFRMWMPRDQSSWFRDLSLVESEVREQIDRYAVESLTPRELGVRIRMHPALAITAAAKMRNADVVSVSFGSSRPQTTLLPLRPATLANNQSAIEQFLKSASNGGEKTDFQAGSSASSRRLGFSGIKSEEILKLISDFEFAENQTHFTPKALSDYIKAEVNSGGLNDWRVVVMEGSGEKVDLAPVGVVRTVIRSRLDDGHDTIANIRALTRGPDRVIGIDGDSKPTDSAASTDLLRQKLHPKTGILRIYPIDRNSVPKGDSRQENGLDRVPLNANATVYGLGFDFPSSMEPHRAIKCAVANIPEMDIESFETDLDEALYSDEQVAIADSEIGDND